jgi:hypothetical protein
MMSNFLSNFYCTERRGLTHCGASHSERCRRVAITLSIKALIAPIALACTHLPVKTFVFRYVHVFTTRGTASTCPGSAHTCAASYCRVGMMHTASIFFSHSISERYLRRSEDARRSGSDVVWIFMGVGSSVKVAAAERGDASALWWHPH